MIASDYAIQKPVIFSVRIVTMNVVILFLTHPINLQGGNTPKGGIMFKSIREESASISFLTIDDFELHTFTTCTLHIYVKKD